jgi:hypothetical protein
MKFSDAPDRDSMPYFKHMRDYSKLENLLGNETIHVQGERWKMFL